MGIPLTYFGKLNILEMTICLNLKCNLIQNFHRFLFVEPNKSDMYIEAL